MIRNSLRNSGGRWIRQTDADALETNEIWGTTRLKRIGEAVAESVGRKVAALAGDAHVDGYIEAVMPQSRQEVKFLRSLYDKFEGWSVDLLRQQPIFFHQQILEFNPTDYQTPMLNLYGSGEKRITNRWSRQSGKTKSSCAMIVEDCIVKPHHRWMVTGPAKRVSEVVMAKMQEHYYSMNPLLARALITDALKTNWTFRNGSTIIATPNAVHALRGDTLDGALLEEYEFVKDASTVMESIIKPMLATTDGMLIANSTPWDPKGEFARLFCTAECHPERGEHRPGAHCGEWRQFYVTWEQALRAGIIKDAFARETILPLKESDFGKYQREWMAEWAEELNTYFPIQLLTQSTEPMLVYEDYADSESRWAGEWLLGLDLGEEVDHSFLVGLRRRSKDSKIWEVAHRKMWPLHTPLSEIRGHVVHLYDKIEALNGCFIDATNNTYFAQDLQTDVGVTEGVRFVKSGDNWPLSIGKESFFSYLKTGMRSGRLVLAYDGELYEHLNVVKYEMGTDGHYRFRHDDGTHDDGAFAIGLAWYGTHDSTTDGAGLTVTDHKF